MQNPPSEIEQLKRQLSDLSSMIATTIKEIGGVRHPAMHADRLHGAVDELAAIVLDTESATDVILGAAEELEALAAEAADGAGASLRHSITVITTRIFEACNFQDLSGQRIAKVTTLLRDIDTRLSAIIEAIGVARFEASGAQTSTKPALLNGPALNDGLKQSSIDALLR